MSPRCLLAASLGAALLSSNGRARGDEPAPPAPPPPAPTSPALAIPAADAPPPLVPRAAGTRLSLDTDIWPAQDFLVVTMALHGQIAVHPHFALDVDVPWAVGGFHGSADTLGAEQTQAVLGNLTLGAHGFFLATPDAALSGGLSVTIPTRLSYDSSSAGVVAFDALAAVTRGYVDAHRFFPETAFVRAPLGAEVRLTRFLSYRGELTPVLWAPLGVNFPSKAVQLMLEHADELEGRAPFGLAGGLRFQVAFAVSDSGGISSGTINAGFEAGDRAQTALEPFLGYEPRGTGVFARLGLLVALNGPAGFGFDKDKLAVIRTQVGGKF